MKKIDFLNIFLFFSGCFLVSKGDANCSVLENFEGTILRELNVGPLSKTTSECWTIKPGYFITLNITDMSSDNKCSNGYIEITGPNLKSKQVFCEESPPKYPLLLLSGTTITAIVRNRYTFVSHSSYFTYTLQYTMKSWKCLEANRRFVCDNYTCIDKHQVCDGVRDCSNGADEIGCDTGVLALDGVEEARKAAVSWLLSKRTAPWGWKANTARAVVALYLSGAARFDGANVSEEIIAKEAELQTCLEFLKPSTKLAMLLHSLLVICHNPRHFFGHNLVQKLYWQTELNMNVTHPLSYLALCNSKQSWPDKATEDLSYFLESDSTYPFLRDIQAMAVMAVTCKNRNQEDVVLLNSSLLTLVNNTIKRFKAFQLDDGSFGNEHTTALIVQALLSSGHEHSKDWEMEKSIHYLMRKLNSSSIDFVTTYLTLPILNGKTLVDISTVNCSFNPRRKDDGAELDEYLGSNILVQYSLIVGDHMDDSFTMFLRVPKNCTAFQLMKLAAAKEPKYKFLWKNVSNQKYVYEIASIKNDPEASKFWLLHIATNSSEPPQHLDSSPDEVTLKNKDHLVMWYKTVHL